MASRLRSWSAALLRRFGRAGAVAGGGIRSPLSCHSERSSRWAEVAVEVLVVAGAFGRDKAGWIPHAGRRIPQYHQRSSLVMPRDSSTALRPRDRLRFAQNDTRKEVNHPPPAPTFPKRRSSGALQELA